ncbi:MAG: nitroreductase family protein, partial [Candidatus Cloacimonetes bacterium]|nr:nitroreductase family protein [Candidatus Cloacimonadota bacterium]
DGPVESEKPSAYIILLTYSKGTYILADVGIAAQSILLGAVEKGFGGCMFGSVKRDKLRELFHIPQEYDIPLIIALGKPREKVVIEDVKTDIKYWRDKDGVHHVPKRKLEDLIIKF